MTDEPKPIEVTQACEAALRAWQELPADERNGERPWIMGFNAGWEAALDSLAHTPAPLAAVERVIERLLQETESSPSYNRDADGNWTATPRYVNPDGPEAARIIAALRQSDQADTPEALKHDLVQSMDTAHHYVNECDRLREAAVAECELSVEFMVGKKLWSVWEQVDENHRQHSDMGDREGDIRFLSLGLTGEAGELANFIKKRWRDGDEHHDAICKEIADVCAYAFMLANVMGQSPGELLDIMAEKQRVFVEKMLARTALGDHS